MRSDSASVGLVAAGAAVVLIGVGCVWWAGSGPAREATSRPDVARQVGATVGSPDGSAAYPHAGQGLPATELITVGGGAPVAIPVLTEESVMQIASSVQALAMINLMAASSTDRDFCRLVERANTTALMGDVDEQRELERLIDLQEFNEAKRLALGAAERPGGAYFGGAELVRALGRAGRDREATAVALELGERSLGTLSQMESLGLSRSLPDLYEMTFWRSYEFLPEGSDVWRRTLEVTVRVAAQFDRDDTDSQGQSVRSLGEWASSILRDEEERRALR